MWALPCSFQQLAKSLGVPFAILHVEADEPVLIARITRRRQLGNEPSEAGVDVLKSQLAIQEPLLTSEMDDVLRIEEADVDSLDALLGRLRDKCLALPGQ